MDKLNVYISYGEYDHDNEFPTLVIQGDNWSVGYSVCPDSGAIEGQVCICHAYSESECVCGAWDNNEDREAAKHGVFR